MKQYGFTMWYKGFLGVSVKTMSGVARLGAQR